MTTKITTSSRLAQYDAQLRIKHGPILIGIDEAGRGAFAGPISAGAVILPNNTDIPGLNDSKKLTHEVRVRLVDEIKKVALAWAVAFVTVDEINARTETSPMNWVNGEVMRRAAEQALAMFRETNPDANVNLYILDQFNQRDRSPAATLTPYIMASKMDGTSLSVAAASVLAKVERDSLMEKLALTFPEYGLEINKGYVRPEHIVAVKAHGRKKELHRMNYMVEGINKPRQVGIFDILAGEDEELEGK